ncbi:MAG: type I-C CRISPR-associated protein Cas8c/Csd1 [Deltaproteobacteria bacterium]|nr:type I-C CRISPR-associated protein Cas8c/Csd1 [Deltaproteobacteria bacterium]
MIIQSLVSLYDRLSDTTGIVLPSQGYAPQKISFAFVININGELVQVRDLREPDGNKLRPKIIILPSIERSGQGFSPQFMWDNTQYALGATSKNEKSSEISDKKRERALDAFEAFKGYHHQFLANSHSQELISLDNFLCSWNPNDAEALENWEDVADTNIVFMIDGQRRFLHEMDFVKEKWLEIYTNREMPVMGNCLLTGKSLPLARLHPMLKNVDGAQAKGAAIVSFNNSAFCSYGKEQSYNSPLNVKDAFKYTASLNYLLRRGVNYQRVKIADATTVFWTERDSPVESFMGFVLDPHDDIGDNIQLKAFLNAAKKGTMPQELSYDGNVKFYILGLAPNNSRLAVRFWHMCTVDQLKERIGRHFNDLDMERVSERDIEFPGIWHLLKETARETKDISPLLGGALVRSTLAGVNYPLNLYNGVLNRIKADQRINYLRASIIKAVLKRNFKMEVAMSLDKGNMDIAYLIGRLFAILEKAQQDAIPGANSTIKDRFYGAASATPASVFPRLLRLAQHHIDKAEYGYVSDRRIAEIMDNINDFPEHLNSKQQGLFAIGYYHQRNDLFKKNESVKEGEK